MCISMYIYIYLFIYLLIYLFMYLFICVFIDLFIYINKVSSGIFYDTNQKNMGSPILLQCDMPALDFKKKNCFVQYPMKTKTI